LHTAGIEICLHCLAIRIPSVWIEFITITDKIVIIGRPTGKVGYEL